MRAWMLVVRMNVGCHAVDWSLGGTMIAVGRALVSWFRVAPWRVGSDATAERSPSDENVGGQIS
eukprot:2367052-Prymnesium_polylepis.1